MCFVGEGLGLGAEVQDLTMAVHEPQGLAWGLGLRVSSLPQVDRIWLWVYYNKIPIYPIFYLLQGDYSS